MTRKDLSAGDYVASRCTKCKDMTNHTIIAMVDAEIVKVECNTCGGTHKYRAAAKQTAAKKTTKKAKTPSKAQREWEEIETKASQQEVIPYNMSNPGNNDMLIMHPSFGLGLVVSCIKPNKMEVRFASGIKMLRGKIA